MLSQTLLPNLRRTLRRGITALSDDEPVDLVFLATILCNFNPERIVPHWLVIVSGPGVFKTRLVETVLPWKRWVFPFVTGITPGFLLSTKPTNNRPSPLERIRRDGIRILLSKDATGFTEINQNTSNMVYAQLRDLHDGFLYRESGLTNEPKVYDPLPEERLGWIVAATPDWYDFQRRHHDLGTRFSVYYFDSFSDWSSTSDLTSLEESSGARDAETKADMSMAVIAYLEAAIQYIKRISDVIFPKPYAEQIAAAVKLTMRIISDGSRGGDTGKRLYFRAREMAMMLAFMHGRRLVNALDVAVVLRFVFSQMPPGPQALVRLAVLRGGKKFSQPDLIEFAGGTLRSWERVVRNMRELGIIERGDEKGYGESYGFMLTDAAAQLTERVALQVAEPELLIEAPKDLEGLVV